MLKERVLSLTLGDCVRTEALYREIQGHYCLQLTTYTGNSTVLQQNEDSLHLLGSKLETIMNQR